LAEIGKRLGRKALREIACIAKPDTILAWYRHLVAQNLMARRYAKSGAGRESNKK
jgi:putative transposase